MLETFSSFGAFTVLGIGLLFGLKHATEVDHIVAVSTIVSQHRNLMRSALVGALWGAGHTAALLVTGAIVLSLRIAIPLQVGSLLEFGVALMIIGLGVSALWRALRKRDHLHVHQHSHDGMSHAHIHFHEDATKHGPQLPAYRSSHSHAISGVGIKPLLVGTMHGLAGSAALTLVVLTQIQSAMLGLLYLAVFGFGSLVGMLLMSGIIGLPFALTSQALSGLHYRLQTVAAAVSIMFGLWYAYHTGLTLL